MADYFKQARSALNDFFHGRRQSTSDLAASERRDHARRLQSGGVGTRRALAATDDRELSALGERIAVPAPILVRHRDAARLSVELTDHGRDRAILVNIPASDPPRGAWRVPSPVAGDVFLHAELDPYRVRRRFTYAAMPAISPPPPIGTKMASILRRVCRSTSMPMVP